MPIDTKLDNKAFDNLSYSIANETDLFIKLMDSKKRNWSDLWSGALAGSTLYNNLRLIANAEREFNGKTKPYLYYDSEYFSSPEFRNYCIDNGLIKAICKNKKFGEEVVKFLPEEYKSFSGVARDLLGNEKFLNNILGDKDKTANLLEAFGKIVSLGGISKVEEEKLKAADERLGNDLYGDYTDEEKAILARKELAKEDESIKAYAESLIHVVDTLTAAAVDPSVIDDFARNLNHPTLAGIFNLEAVANNPDVKQYENLVKDLALDPEEFQDLGRALLNKEPEFQEFISNMMINIYNTDKKKSESLGKEYNASLVKLLRDSGIEDAIIPLLTPKLIENVLGLKDMDKADWHPLVERLVKDKPKEFEQLFRQIKANKEFKPALDSILEYAYLDVDITTEEGAAKSAEQLNIVVNNLTKLAVDPNAREALVPLLDDKLVEHIFSLDSITPDVKQYEKLVKDLALDPQEFQALGRALLNKEPEFQEFISNMMTNIYNTDKDQTERLGKKYNASLVKLLRDPEIEDAIIPLLTPKLIENVLGLKDMDKADWHPLVKRLVEDKPKEFENLFRQIKKNKEFKPALDSILEYAYLDVDIKTEEGAAKSAEQLNIVVNNLTKLAVDPNAREALVPLLDDKLVEHIFSLKSIAPEVKQYEKLVKDLASQEEFKQLASAILGNDQIKQIKPIVAEGKIVNDDLSGVSAIAVQSSGSDKRVVEAINVEPAEDSDNEYKKNKFDNTLAVPVEPGTEFIEFISDFMSVPVILSKDETEKLNKKQELISQKKVADKERKQEIQTELENIEKIEKKKQEIDVASEKSNISLIKLIAKPGVIESALPLINKQLVHNIIELPVYKGVTPEEAEQKADEVVEKITSALRNTRVQKSIDNLMRKEPYVNDGDAKGAWMALKALVQKEKNKEATNEDLKVHILANVTKLDKSLALIDQVSQTSFIGRITNSIASFASVPFRAGSYVVNKTKALTKEKEEADPLVVNEEKKPNFYQEAVKVIRELASNNRPETISQALHGNRDNIAGAINEFIEDKTKPTYGTVLLKRAGLDGDKIIDLVSGSITEKGLNAIADCIEKPGISTGLNVLWHNKGSTVWILPKLPGLLYSYMTTSSEVKQPEITNWVEAIKSKNSSKDQGINI